MRTQATATTTREPTEAARTNSAGWGGCGGVGGGLGLGPLASATAALKFHLHAVQQKLHSAADPSTSRPTTQGYVGGPAENTHVFEGVEGDERDGPADGRGEEPKQQREPLHVIRLRQRRPAVQPRALELRQLVAGALVKGDGDLELC